MDLSAKARAATKRHDMPLEGRPVWVALSGGADSMALLHYLRNETAADVRALHVNHNLRGAAAAADERFVREQCGRLGVPLIVKSYDVAAEAARAGEGVEEAGRRLRYAALAEAAGEGGTAATAHTLSDSVETLLLHMTRGSGLRGLCGIPPVRREGGLTVIRPLTDCTREDVEDYCRRMNVPYVRDETNRDTAFARNRIRHNVIPELKAVNPAVAEALARLMRRAREQVEWLDEEAACALARARAGDAYEIAVLRELPHPLLTHTLGVAAAHAGSISDAGQTDSLLAIMEHGGSVSLSGGVRAQASQGRLRFAGGQNGREPPEKNGETVLEPGVSCTFYKRNLTPRLLPLSEYEKQIKVHKNLLKNSLQYDKISGTLRLRSRREGDAIRLAGRQGTKTLKKLFGELRIPVWERDRVPVMCDDDGVVLIPGVGCAARAAVDENAAGPVMVIDVVNDGG